MTDDMEETTNYLARNATHLGKDNWPETQGTSARERAHKNHDDALIAPEEGMGRYQVQLPDGDPHQVLVVKSMDEYAGACDCDGFQYNDAPCSHLITVRLGEFTDRTDVPESQQYVVELANDDAVADGGGEDAGQMDSSEDADAELVEKEEPAQTPSTPARDDAFAKPLPNVDDEYMITMNGEKYIRRAGYARLLSQIEAHPEFNRDVRAKDTDYERAEVTAKIVDNNTGKVLGEGIGTAGPPGKEDMSNAEMHLDELAETRAWTRAASIATGEGYTAFAEMPGNASEVVGDD